MHCQGMSFLGRKRLLGSRLHLACFSSAIDVVEPNSPLEPEPSQSKPTKSQRNHAYRLSNRDRIASLQLAWSEREGNDDRAKKWSEDYYLKNTSKIKERAALFRAKNPARAKTIQKTYYEKASDKLREKGRDYWEQNKAEMTRKHQTYYSENKAKIKEQSRLYKQKHSDRFSLQNKLYYWAQKSKRIDAEKKQLLDSGELKVRVERVRSLLNISQANDWHSVPMQYILAADRGMKGAIRLFGSLCTVLQRVYPAEQFDASAFLVQGKGAWSDPDHTRRFLEEIGKRLHITRPEDWTRISLGQVKQLSESMHYHFGGKLSSALAFAYPEYDWSSLFLARQGGKKWSRQRELVTLVTKLLPRETEIVENYLHPELKWAGTDRHVEIDIWIPEYKLGFEYQGEHHYQDMATAYGPYGALPLYMQRDREKKGLCERVGITYIPVPYWWMTDSKICAEQLAKVRPEIAWGLRESRE